MKFSKKLLVPALFGAALMVAAPAQAADYGQNSGTADPAQLVPFTEAANQTVEVHVIVGESIGLDCADSVNLGQLVGSGNVIGNVECSVFTNNTDGYNVTVGTMSPIALNTTQEGGNPVGQAATDLQKFVPSTTPHTDMTDAAKAAWALSTNGGTTWLGVGEVVKTSDAASLPTGDNFNVNVGAHAGTDIGGAGGMLEGGNYVGSFTLTATTI